MNESVGRESFVERVFQLSKLEIAVDATNGNQDNDEVGKRLVLDGETGEIHD